MNKRVQKWLLAGIGLLLIWVNGACGRMVSTNENQEAVEIKENDLKIAAVGDSITAEYTPETGYPEILADLLGEGYAVLNFGESNYAAQASSDFPYETTASYSKSRAWQPDVVILMLGTNDSKANNWQGSKKFKEEYTNLLESYLKLASEPRVILAAPPSVFVENSFPGSIEADHIQAIRAVISEVADEYALEFVDMTEKTADHPEWFFDGIHPTKEGASAIAQIFYKQIENK